MKHCIPDAHEAAIIATFHANVKNSRMLEKMSTRSIKTINALFELADKVSRVEEAVLPVNRDAGKRNAPRGFSGKGNPSRDSGALKRGHHTVFTTVGNGAASQPPSTETVVF